jgi:hypothetical protein
MAEKTLSIKLSLNDKQFQSNLKKSMRSMKKFGNNMKSLGRTISTGLTLPILAFGAASVKAFDEQIKAETSLRTALGNNAEAFANLAEQARELQKVTIFGDEATLQAQSFLAQLGLNEQAILRLTPLIQDFATAQGIQLTDAAKLVAKSVGSSTNALSRYGITIDGAVGEQERLQSAVDALTVAFGGQAKAIAKEGLGPLQQLKNELGDVSEKFGEIILEFIDPLTKGLQKVSEALSNLTEEQKKNIVKYGAIVAAVGPLLIVFGSLVTILTTLIPLAISFVAAINPITIAIAAAAAAVLYLVYRFRDLQKEYEDYNEVVGDFEPIVPFVPTTTTPTAPAIQRSTIPERIEPIKALSVATKDLSKNFETLKPIVEEFEEGLSSMDIVANDINQSFMSFGNVIQGVFAQALQSQEGFFKSFLEGAKQALNAMLAQIAAMLILNALLGGTGIGALMGLKNIGGLAGIGDVLGGVGNVNANSVGGGVGLKSMINTGGSTEVFGTISGADILLSSDRARNNRNRTRGY